MTSPWTKRALRRLIGVSGYPTSICHDTGAILVPKLAVFDALGWMLEDDTGAIKVWRSILPFRWTVRRWLGQARSAMLDDAPQSGRLAGYVTGQLPR